MQYIFTTGIRFHKTLLFLYRLLLKFKLFKLVEKFSLQKKVYSEFLSGSNPDKKNPTSRGHRVYGGYVLGK